jgi:sensor histidine kinase YesM
MVFGSSIISFTVYLNSKKIIREDIEKLSQIKVEKMVTLIEGKLLKWKSEIEILSKTDEAQQRDIEKLKEYILERKDIYDDYEMFMVSDVRGQYKGTTGFDASISERDYFHAVMQGRTVVSDPVISKATGIPVIEVAAPIRNSRDQVIGAIIGTVKMTYLTQIVMAEKFGKTGFPYMINQDGLIMIHPDKEKIFKENLLQSQSKSLVSVVNKMIKGGTGVDYYTSSDGVENIVTYSIVNSTGWPIAISIENNEVSQPVVHLANRTVGIGLAITIFMLIILTVAIDYLVKPLLEIAAVTKLVAGGNLSVRANSGYKDEIGELARGFNNMLDKINNLIAKVYQEEDKKREAELKALQAQINPHFLYNTLNTIRWMAVIQKADNISKMIVSLIKLLELSGKRVGKFISIEQELEHAQNYIYLQKIRYNDKFEVEYDIDENLLKYKIIKFVLQPIIENAIFHGIEPKDGSGTIKIIISKVEDMIRFQVVDNGVGMDEKIDVDKNRSFSGLGIENVNERLIRNFGEDSKLIITSHIEKGTKVEFYLPMFIDEEGMVNKNVQSNDC